jgi:glycine/D-amino acid oxidase-like deaminating enzyme/nitrite reductase/ring-hydroxylating ferredoxin subunit
MNNKLEFKEVPSPYWIASTSQTDYPELNKDIDVDVAIIGGGIVGITSAYQLQNEGVKVAVIEADRILQGTTGHSTAKITSQHSLIYARLKNQMGEELAQQYAESNERAIHLIADTVNENKIDCDFSWRSAYVYTQSDKYVQDIQDEVEAASSLGIKAYYLEEIPLPFEIKAAERFDNQAQFHPVKYLQALAAKITESGGYIFEQTEAINIEDNGVPQVITRKGNKVRANKVIIASHYPFFDGGGLFFSRIYQEKSYIVAVKIKEQFPEGMFITAEGPGRSLRSQSYEDGELVLLAGEHHKTGYGNDTNVHYQNLIDFGKSNFQVQDILYRWSTQDCMTIDGVPYIGNLTPRSPNLYLATGFGKWGISNGTAAGMILSDLITHGESPWAEVYNPYRFKLSSLKTFVWQNVDVAKSLVAGKLERLPEDIEIKTGEAQVIGVDGERVGAYRDEQGKLHMIDTTCTHLGCELQWNDGERSWDCPCHGSRFSYEGDIVEGPAINRLHHLEQGPNEVEARVFS